MSEIIVVTSGKGGVGKSTLTANLGVCLSSMGKKTCLIDMDMGLRSLDVFLGLENKVIYDLADLVEGVCRDRQALIKCPEIPGLSLIAAAQTRGNEAVDENRLSEIMERLRRQFDYVLIDCPAGVGHGFLNATACADRALIISTPDVVALRDAERLNGLIRRRDVEKSALVLNRVLPQHLGPNAPAPLSAFRERLSIDVVGVIPENPRMYLYTSQGKPVALKQREPSARAIWDTARRLIGENVELKLPRAPGPLARLKERFQAR